MKKYILILVVIIGLSIWQVLHMYITVQGDRSTFEQNYIQLVEQAYDGVRIINTYRYHGEELWWIFYVYLPEQEDYAYVTIDPNSGEHLLSLNADQIFSIEELPQYALDHFAELTSVNRVVPAVIRKKLAWEVSAEDQNNQLVYLYFDMESGHYLMRYTIQ